jgi:EAL domain-containing protein (putative c-di-GMP-specific phosphodiesterase class I)
VTEALARAQESLHRARQRGYGRFVAYVPSRSQQEKRRENAALSSEMVAALETNRLQLFFQPVVDTVTRELRFHEGLLRLERANGTFAPATDFIELCEQLGIIRLIDHYVLNRSLETLEAFPNARLSLNVSGETIGDAEWLSRLAETASRVAGLTARLVVEITETAVIRNLEEASHFIATLHDLGCSVAIDDFGAGFSSFRHLRTLDVDVVKIAGAFIENLPRSRDDQAFVKALTELARTFDIEVVAEWVQDEETVGILAGLGVQMIQGAYAGMASPEWSLSAQRVTPAVLAARKAG